MYSTTPALKKKATPKAQNPTANRCAYCGKFQTESYQITTSLGIAACMKHAEWAKWDCRIYMHKEGQARLEDGLIHAPIRSFIQALDALPSGFSDGEKGGWHLMKERRPFFVHVEGAWTIPIYNEKLSIAKRMPLRRFQQEDVIGPILDDVPLEFPQYAQYTMSLLNWGIYSDYDRVTGSL